MRLAKRSRPPLPKSPQVPLLEAPFPAPARAMVADRAVVAGLHNRGHTQEYDYGQDRHRHVADRMGVPLEPA
jgi:hypothetical protein